MKYLVFLICFFLFSSIQGQEKTGVAFLKQANELEDTEGIGAAILLLEENLASQDTLTKLKFIDQLSGYYGRKQDYEKAIDLKEQALNGFKAIPNDTLTASCLYGFSKLFNDRYDYDQGYKYLQEAITYARTSIDSAKITSSMGVYFRRQNKIDTARQLYLRGMELHPQNEDPRFFAIAYNNLAILEKSQGNYELSLQYYDKSTAYYNILGAKTEVASIDVNKTYILYDLEKFKEAENILNSVEEITMKSGSTVEKLNFDLIRYNIAEKQGKYAETLKYYRRFKNTKDSVDNVKINTKIAEFEVKYETAEKEKLLAITESELTQANLQRKYLLAGLSSIFTLCFFGGLYFWSRYNYQKKLSAEKLKTMSVESMYKGQETERLRIANDLHDSLGGLLTTIKIHVDKLSGNPNNAMVDERTQDVTKLVNKATQELRRISHNMVPSALNIAGLDAALSDLCSEIQATKKINVNYQWIGGDIESEDHIAIYRIVQEACNNAMKHAEAENLLVQVNVLSDRYSIMVEDDGRGYDNNNVNGGMGLRSIESRGLILKAQVDIDSKVDKGTTVLVTKNLYP